jgi:putative Mg2+ transporter-C (MgtC) family protein
VGLVGFAKLTEQLLPSDIAVRIGCAFAAGLVIGWERESHGRAAGLRTTILVCTAAATAMLLSDRLYVETFYGKAQTSGWHPDPARLAAGILTGMGFLGGGVILRQGNLIRGVTTASVLWFITVIGLCFGGGYLLLGFAGVAVSFLTLIALPPVERFAAKDWYAVLHVTTSLEGTSVSEITGVLNALKITVKSLDWSQDLVQRTRTVKFFLKFKKSDLVGLPERIVNDLTRRAGVLQVHWK